MNSSPSSVGRVRAKKVPDPAKYAEAVTRMKSRARGAWQLYLSYRSKGNMDRAWTQYAMAADTLVCLHILRGDTLSAPRVHPFRQRP